MALIWIWLVTLISVFVLYLYRTYTIFSRKGVKTPPVFPLIGTSYKTMFLMEHMTEDITRNYGIFSKERFIGKYDFLKPAIIIHDLELIKKIAIKDFENFIDHRILIDLNADPLFGRNLLSLKGEQWKDMRGTLSPAFTSSKIRLMVPFMVEVGDQMIKSLEAKLQESSDGYIDVEVKDMITRNTNDVIASCAFGLKVNSHFDKENEFYLKGKQFSTFKLKQMFILIGWLMVPRLMKVLKYSVFPEDLSNFFRTIILGTMRDREEHNIMRPDMIHLLMQAKKGKLSHEDKTDTDAGFATVEESVVGKKTINRVWSDDDLVAQAVLFFAAGFETVGSGMSFLLYELATNPDIQEKVYQEIRENDEKNNGKFDYNSIQKMTYLDMVVSEALRLWPPAVALDRGCMKDYNIGKPNEDAKEDIILKPGDGIAIPVWAIHRDPKYFPDPLKFDPERFSDENKHKIKPFTYMPFGLGPRNCIGSRFALCEMKVMVYQLLRSMELSPGAKTKIPLVLSKKEFTMAVDGGNWLRFRPRNN